jgi:hypothetical protein
MNKETRVQRDILEKRLKIKRGNKMNKNDKLTKEFGKLSIMKAIEILKNVSL